MAAVTQRIGNYLGGVSKQSDDKKLPGQVRECFNGYPDPTYGLTKRPGFQHIANLGTGTSFDDAKWFYINRDDDEEYIAAIKGNTISVWNALSGVACTVNYGSGAQAYLSGQKTDYKLLTVQDTTLVINSSVTVAAQAAPTFIDNTRATLVLTDTPTSSTYSVTVQGTTVTYTSGVSGTYDDILTNLKTSIDGIGVSGLTVTKYKQSLSLVRVVSSTPTAFTVSAKGGAGNNKLSVFQDQVDNVSRLPFESFHNHVVKVINTNSAEDTYFVKYVADNGVSGDGFWEETRSPKVSPGLDDSTMPHELINTSLNTFTFQKVAYEDRLVGDDKTNEHPSFVGNKITAGFFHSNRLGYLSKDNVCMSQSSEFYNFYHMSAQTVVDADPVDLSCSSVRPTALHAVIPTTQGVVLFSGDQQFLLFSDNGVITPSMATIRTLSNYEMDTSIDPVDIGTNINFVSKTPGYTRVFSMVTRGQNENPQVLDVGRVVKEWISPDIDNLIASAQNQFLCLYGQTERELYIFRYYNDGEKNLMEAWVSWIMPGTTQFVAVDSDTMYAVTKQGSQFTLCKTALSQSPDDAIIVNNQGERVNPCMDLYKAASSVVYDAVADESKCYLPYNDVAMLDPVLVIKGTTQQGAFVESGFTITPERGSDGTGPFFKVPKKNLTTVAADVMVGFKYNFDVHLPRTYFRPEPNVTDYTASLVISRMNFSIGLSGVMNFKLSSVGRKPAEVTFTGDGTTTSFNFNKPDLPYLKQEDVNVTVNGVIQSAYSFTNDTTIQFTTAPADGAEIKFDLNWWQSVASVITADDYLANDVPLEGSSVVALPVHQRTENFLVRMFNNSPFPTAINGMSWEGHYTPRFYRRA